MKSFVLSLILAIPHLLFAQVQSKSSKLDFGFNLGFHSPILLTDNSIPKQSVINKSPSTRLGIMAEYQLNNYFSILPRTELVFNDVQINWPLLDGNQSSYSLANATLESMIHLKVADASKTNSLYFYAGPNFKAPVQPKVVSITTFFYTRNDLAIDFGIGLDKRFSKFKLAPELRYSYGLTNINGHPAIRSLKMHNVAMLFNFIG